MENGVRNHVSLARVLSKTFTPPHSTKPTHPQVDVMVLYTKKAKFKTDSDEGTVRTSSQMETYIITAYEGANNAFLDSGIDLKIRVVHVQEVLCRVPIDLGQPNLGRADHEMHRRRDLVGFVAKTHPQQPRRDTIIVRCASHAMFSAVPLRSDPLLTDRHDNLERDDQIDFVEGNDITDAVIGLCKGDQKDLQVHELRDRYGADLVQMIAFYPNTCGIGWVIES